MARGSTGSLTLVAVVGVLVWAGTTVALAGDPLVANSETVLGDALAGDDSGGALQSLSLPAVLFGSDDAAAATGASGGAGGSAAESVAGGDGPDADGDGLPDSREREVYGTDPYDADTDGDGLPDGVEVACTGRYPDADPLRHDVYLEVDAVGDERVSDRAVGRLVAAFADAPVENPDGSTGVDVHVHRSDDGLDAAGTVNSHAWPGEADDVLDFRDRYADRHGAGYYYVLVAPEVAYRGDDYYVGAGRSGTVLVETLRSPRLTASLLMHELGHGFGLDRHRDGVDEDGYTVEEYHSVMSYSGLYDVLDYSDGTDDVGRDEWAFVADDRFVPGDGCDSPAECGCGA